MMKVFRTIGTHDGQFHCDEVLACFLLKLLPQFKDADIVRTRDDKVLDTCDIVVDVGGVYDLQKLRFDHHQRDFKETMSSIIPGKPWTIKLSSAGLVYCHFGHDVLKQLLPDSSTDKELEAIYHYMYDTFVQEIDAVDNGIPISDGDLRYKITTNLSSRVGHLNPSWNHPDEDPKGLQRFMKALQLVGEEFKERVNYAINSWWPARSFVLNAINTRFNIHKSGHIMQLEQVCPWKQHYFELVKDLNIDPESINFVVFRDIKGPWRVQGIPTDAASFTGKIFLASDWRGLRDEELSKVSGVEGCIFVHASGFIGGNLTREGAIEMAVKSIEQQS